jgi:hypothetical protein
MEAQLGSPNRDLAADVLVASTTGFHRLYRVVPPVENLLVGHPRRLVAQAEAHGPHGGVGVLDEGSPGLPGDAHLVGRSNERTLAGTAHPSILEENPA